MAVTVMETESNKEGLAGYEAWRLGSMIRGLRLRSAGCGLCFRLCILWARVEVVGV